MKSYAALFFALLVNTTHAGPSTSTDYTVPTGTIDAAGKRATSAAYAHDGSAGLIAGLSTVSSPAESAKHGYIGQLYDVTSVAITASTLALPR